MDISTITSNVISEFFKLLPYVWQAVVGFLLGCWFYRYMLKTNPARLQALVNLVNGASAVANAVVTNVIDDVTAATTTPKAGAKK